MSCFYEGGHADLFISLEEGSELSHIIDIIATQKFNIMAELFMWLIRELTTTWELNTNNRSNTSRWKAMNIRNSRQSHISVNKPAVPSFKAQSCNNKRFLLDKFLTCRWFITGRWLVGTCLTVWAFVNVLTANFGTCRGWPVWPVVKRTGFSKRDPLLQNSIFWDTWKSARSRAQFLTAHKTVSQNQLTEANATNMTASVNKHNCLGKKGPAH